MNTFTHTQYVFTPGIGGVGTVTLTNMPTGLVVQNIKYIKNLTRDVVIYDPLAFTTKGGTLASNVITLTFDTTGHLPGDTLEIILEAGALLSASNGTLTSGDGTITLGGTAQVLFAALTNRMGWSIMNTSNAVLYVNDLGTATTASYAINPGAEYNPPAVSTGAISILGVTTGQTFTARQWQLPNALNSTLFVQGATPAGQQVSASSHPVVLPTDYSAADSVQWIVNVAGTGYAVRDILRQNISVRAGVVTNVWFNVTQGTVLATNPTAPQIATNLRIYNPTIPAQWKASNRWIVANTPVTNCVSPFVYCTLRNTGSVPVRIISLEMSVANTNSNAANEAKNMLYRSVLYVGSGATVGGSNTNAYNMNTGVLDGTIIGGSGHTAISTGTSTFTVATGMYISGSYVTNTTYATSTEIFVNRFGWAEGFIIPPNSVLEVRNENSYAAPVGTQYPGWTAVLTDEL